MLKCKRLATLALAALLAGCGPAYIEKLDAPYYLIATDSMEQLSLAIPIGGGTYSGDGLPGETVFMAGADPRHVVLAIHPRTWPDLPNRAVTEFYYIIRHPDEASGLVRGNVRGPYDARAFDAEKRRLGLPAFTRVFEELR